MTANDNTSLIPLAARLRPQSLEEFFGQQHLLNEGKPLQAAIISGRLHSMILWGPPGSGKTTLACLIAHYAKARVEKLSAVLAGVKDIRAAVDRANKARQLDKQNTILFIDEIHRFNKAQQDAFLPDVEEGIVTLIGATTENPSFALNNALLSRTRVYILRRLTNADIRQVIDSALLSQRGFPYYKIKFADNLREKLVQAADGDARQALNFLEIAIEMALTDKNEAEITEKILHEVIRDGVRQFDKNGDLFYEQISALHKSVRGSSPDAALYWLARMLDGGCDPLYIARRMLRMASEDIGNADPRGLQLALAAYETLERLGSPEGELALAQAIVYLACAPKSNAIYKAFNAALTDAKNNGSLEVPLHLRNASTKLMKDLHYGKNYRYAHDEPNAYVAGENYFPEAMPAKNYYQPVARGLEIKIAEKLAALRKLDKEKDNH